MLAKGLYHGFKFLETKPNGFISNFFKILGSANKIHKIKKHLNMTEDLGVLQHHFKKEKQNPIIMKLMQKPTNTAPTLRHQNPTRRRAKPKQKSGGKYVIEHGGQYEIGGKYDIAGNRTIDENKGMGHTIAGGDKIEDWLQ